MKLLILLALLVSGCAQIKGEVTHDYDKYLAQFNSDLMALGEPTIDFSQTTILKSDVGNVEMGHCGAIENKRSGITFIQISKNLPKYVSDESLTILIYHEIGHCFFGLNHVDDSDSIMNEQVPLNLRSLVSNEVSRIELVNQMVR